MISAPYMAAIVSQSQFRKYVLHIPFRDILSDEHVYNNSSVSLAHRESINILIHVVVMVTNGRVRQNLTGINEHTLSNIFIINSISQLNIYTSIAIDN